MKASDYNLERDIFLSIPSGRVPYASSVNKYGYAPQGVQTTATDIWDRADAAATQQIWLAPATSELHNIKSTSAVDTNTGPGVGANKIQVYGLIDWDTKEVSEIIELNGTTNVSTVNKYVIIHRMKVISYGSLGPNLGTITATATTGTTPIVAQINLQEGQTQMAIFGIPSVQTAYLTNWYATANERTSATATVKLLYSIDPEGLSASRFVVKETRGLCTDGTSSGVWEKMPYTKFEGPGILKIQATASALDQDMAAGFDLILLDN